MSTEASGARPDAAGTAPPAGTTRLARTAPPAGAHAPAGAGPLDGIALDHRLRMVPADPAEFTRRLETAAAELAEERRDGQADFARTRAVGVGLLVLGRLDHARAVLTDASALADTTARRIAVTINLADAHRYADTDEGRAAAEPLYLRALELARRHVPERVDFALQHLAKHRIDTGRFAEARRLLDEALALRVAAGDAELVASTRQALAHLSAREAG
ncbi:MULTISPECIES: hypothetical protein [unclassified Streptomyces]|uniref:hypothetical protein n=1 Tax=unclassified Streptomyces TaxID=2593676 RepID=UPI000CD4B590|nr:MULTISPECIES: hypothetical protein [unclassified Streptomyces]